MTEIQQTSIETKVDKLIDLMQGNEFDDEDKGLIGRVNDVYKRLEKLEKLRDRAMYVIVGMSLPAGVGIGQLIDIFKHR